MAGLSFEKFLVHPWSRTVTEMDNTMFSLLTMNLQPLHLGAHFSAQTEWGQRLFNSISTPGIPVGMTVNDTTLGTSVANLGMGDVRFPKPVFHGDTLRARTRVVSVRDSKRRSDSGLVELERTRLNQRNEGVAVCERTALMRRKPAQ